MDEVVEKKTRNILKLFPVEHLQILDLTYFANLNHFPKKI